jgi:hypothetical protein
VMLLDCRIKIVYLVIGDPMLSGALHNKTTFVFCIIDVTGAVTYAGT